MLLVTIASVGYAPYGGGANAAEAKRKAEAFWIAIRGARTKLDMIVAICHAISVLASVALAGMFAQLLLPGAAWQVLLGAFLMSPYLFGCGGEAIQKMAMFPENLKVSLSSL
jgi:hypothetical protein